MAMLTNPHALMERLASALGLSDRPIRRIIIDCQINDMARVFVEQYIPHAAADALVSAIEEPADTPIYVQSVEDLSVDLPATGPVITHRIPVYKPTAYELAHDDHPIIEGDQCVS